MAKDVRIKEGTFYLSSKEEKQGWEKQTFQNPQNREETLTRWHKNVSIDGTIEAVEIKDDQYRGKVLSVKFNDKEQGDLYLNLPVYGNGGVKTTDPYFNSFVGPLENLSKGQQVKVFINNKNRDKKDRLYRNVVVLTPDNDLIKSNFSFSDVPSWESKEVKDDFGETTKEWDASEANKFYIAVAKKALANFNGSEAPQKQETPKKENKPKPEKKQEPVAQEQDNDSLPF